jgi:hypothetical protein
LPPTKRLEPRELKNLAAVWRGWYRDDAGFEIPLEMTVKNDGSFQIAIDDPVTGVFQRQEIREALQKFWRTQLAKCVDEAGMSRAGGRELVLDWMLREIFPSRPGPVASPR